MPGFLSLYSGTQVVDLGDGYTVTVKKFLSAVEKDTAKNALTKVKFVDDKPVPDPNVPEYQREVVIAAIVEWNLTDENDQPLTVDRASVNRLPDVVVEKIFDVVNSSEEGRAPLAQATFSGAGVGSDSAG